MDRNLTSIKKALISVGLMVVPHIAQCAYHMVTPAGSGTHSGADWNNAMVGNTVLDNGTLVRGDTYCVGGGTYGNWSFSQSDSGTLPIEIRAAIAADANCGSSVAGWTSAFDTSLSPAVVEPLNSKFDSWAVTVSFGSDYWILNGNGRGGPKSGYHIRIDNSWPHYVAMAVSASQTTGVTVQYIEAIGGGIHEDATEYVPIGSVTRNGTTATVTLAPSCAPGQPCGNPWFNGEYLTLSGMANHPSFNCSSCPIFGVSGNSFSYSSPGTSGETDSSEGTTAGCESQTEEMIRAVGSVINFTLAYSYIHNPMNTPVQLSGITNSNIHDNVIAQHNGTAADHSNAIAIDNDNGLNIYNNVFEDGGSTGFVTTGLNHDADTNLSIWNNVFMCHPGDPFKNCSMGNGVIQLISGTSSSNNIAIYNNTSVGILGLHNGIMSETNLTGYCNIQNNLFYGGAASAMLYPPSACDSYNSYLNLPNGPSTLGAQDVYMASGVPSPFKSNWAGTCTTATPGDLPVCSGENYTLVSDNADWNNRLALSAPYNTDAAGNAFTTDRGAYQYAGSSGDTTPPTVAVTAPANGATVSATITVSGTAADNVAVANVQVAIDGGAYAPASGTSNWTFSLNTTSLTNASHTISAKATDTSGNVSTVASITVTANNVAKPAITSALAASGAAGSAFSYQITASNSPTSFNATGLPAGLSVNTSNGLISGTPTAAGSSNVTLSATNAGGTGSATLAITINNAGGSCFVITPTGSGNLSGSDWGNACAGFTGNCAGSAMVHGDAYYVAGGSGGAYHNTSQSGSSQVVNVTSTAGNASLPITIKAANIADHCTATGWNAATMAVDGGAGQAILTGDGTGTVNVGASNVVIDGNYHPAGGDFDPSWAGSGHSCSGTQCGIKIDMSTANAWQIAHYEWPIFIGSGVSSVTVRSIEFAGCGASCGSQGLHTDVFYLTPTSPQPNYVNILHNYLHHSSQDYMLYAGSKYVVTEWNHFYMNYSSAVNPAVHGAILTPQGGGNNTFAYNAVQDCVGTAVIDSVNSSATVLYEDNLQFYGNIIWMTSGNPNGLTGGYDNGIISCTGGNVCTNWKAYNNSVVNMSLSINNSMSFGGANVGAGSSITEYDNLFWNSTPALNGISCGTTATCTTDYDYFSGTTHTAQAHEQTTTSNPFAAWTSNDFHLLAATNAGISLGAPYNIDSDGKLRGADGVWDRGAYEFNSGSSGGDTTPPTVAIASPANGATVGGTITVSGTAADNVAVANVQVSVDGAAYAAASGTTNWTFSLNTASLTNASHTISAKATDTSGNVSTVASISMTVNNASSGGSCFVITPSGSGNLSGSDWGNACAGFTGKCSGSSMVRGDTYYIAGGSGGGYSAAGAVLNFSVAENGSIPVTIKAATTADHCTSTGFNAATMAVDGGAGQAVLSTPSSEVIGINNGYFIIDGNYQGSSWGNPGHACSGNQCGIQINDNVASSTQISNGFFWGINIGANVKNVTIRSMEFFGAGVAAGSKGMTTDLIRASSGGNSGLTYVHNYMHHSSQCFFQTRATVGTTIEYNYLYMNYSSANNPPVHGCGIDQSGETNLTFAYNAVNDVQGTAMIDELSSGITSGSGEAVYGNVVWMTSGNPNGLAGGYDNGVISCTNGQVCVGWQVYDNTIANETLSISNSLNGGSPVGAGSSITVYNNLFYNSGSANNQCSNWSGGCVDDYNYYSGTTQSAPGPHDQVTTANPFVTWTAGNFHLAAATNAGITLGSPYNTDPDGNIRGADGVWDRGAYEFNSGSSGGDTTPPTAAVTSPANGATISGTITVSGTAADNVAVANVQVSVDSGAYAAASGTTNWTFSLNTASLTNASHTISAKATDTSGNVSTVASISVTVNNVAKPAITSALAASGTVGSAFAYQIAASNSPTSYNATGLPVGLTVNTATGLISGTPTAAGSSSVTLSATNAGGTGTATLALTVFSACDVNRDGSTNALDIQLQVNQAIAVAPCTSDFDHDGVCNVIEVQRVVNAALGSQCLVGP